MDHFTQLLRDLHTFLLRIRTTTEELEAGPQRLKRLQAKVNAAEKSFADYQSALKATKVAIHENEVSLKANTEKLRKHKRDLDTITSKKEYDALNVEIAALEKRNSDLEDATLQLMARLEEWTPRAPELEQAISKAKADYSAAEKEQNTDISGLQARLDEAKRLVAEKRKLLPADWQKSFYRLEQTEGADGMAGLNGKSCSACYTEVTAQQLAMIKSGNISVCKSCGKMLYVNE